MSERAQLPLGFAPLSALAAADFVPTEANAEALAWVEKWPDWPAHGLVLYGPKGSGKTHLAHIWAQKAGAAFITAPTLDKGARLVLEDVGQLTAEGEEMLFHLLNQLKGEGGFILLTAPTPPAQWNIKLPDLRSRLLALPVAQIHEPDDAALAAVMGKLFADRQIRVPAEVIEYLVRRIERSFAAAQAAVLACDAAALATGRAITLPLAREVLARNSEIAS